MKIEASLILSALFLLSGCGSAVVVEPAGGGGSSASSSSATSTSASTSATSVTATSSNVTTGPGPCSSHEQCPGGVCIFATGECAPACETDFCAECEPGTICEACATGSCPGCNDCVAACIPITTGRCDGNDPCPSGEVCLWNYGYCAPACITDSDCDGFSFCDGCATGSCCGCENCTGACVGGE